MATHFLGGFTSERAETGLGSDKTESLLSYTKQLYTSQREGLSSGTSGWRKYCGRYKCWSQAAAARNSVSTIMLPSQTRASLESAPGASSYQPQQMLLWGLVTEVGLSCWRTGKPGPWRYCYWYCLEMLPLCVSPKSRKIIQTWTSNRMIMNSLEGKEGREGGTQL